MLYSHTCCVGCLVCMSQDARCAPWHGSPAEGLKLVSSARLIPQIFPKDVCSAVRLFTFTRALCFLALNTQPKADNGLSYFVKHRKNDCGRIFGL